MSERRDSARFERMLDEEYEGKLKKRVFRKRAVIFVLAAVIIAVAASLLIWQRTRSYTDYIVTGTIEQENDENSEYISFGKHILRVNNDGITCYSSDGALWNQAFEMQRAVMDVCGSYVAVGEVGASQIQVCNQDGPVGSLHTTYPIVKVEVAGQGVVAVLSEDSSANYIEVMDKEGNQLITGRTVLSGNGYPLDFSLSMDGTKLIVSYLYVSGGVTQSKVVFYNFSEVGQNEVDRMVGVFNNYDDMLVPMVEFISEDTAVAVADNCLTFYRMEEKPSELERVTLDGEIKKVCSGDSYIAVLYGEDNRVTLYNRNGKEVFSETGMTGVDRMRIAGDRLLLLSGSECRLLRRSGNEMFRYQFDNGMTDLVPLSKNSFLLQSRDGVQRIRLK